MLKQPPQKKIENRFKRTRKSTEAEVCKRSVPFAKYHGAGNDFILIDNREGKFFLDDPDLIRRLCHRHIGIGADGILLIESSERADVKMCIYNADASTPAMCGNGIRCAFDFVEKGTSEIKIEVCGRIFSCRRREEHVIVNLGSPRIMHWPMETEIQPIYVLDTGVPHALLFVDEISEIPFLKWAQHIRFHPAFGPEGVNVNAVQVQKNGSILLRTYERGVERETLACGTGAAAAAWSAAELHRLKGPICVNTLKLQGEGFEPSLQFCFSLNSRGQRQIEMIGPASCTFTGEFDLKNQTCAMTKKTACKRS